MKQLKDWKGLMPHALILLGFILVTIIYFYPQFDGYKLQQHDVMQFRGMASEVGHYRNTTGEEQLWTNSMFGGMPTVQISLIHTGNFFGSIIRWFLGVFPSPAGMFLLHLIGFYIMALCFRFNRWVAVIGAFAYAFASYEIIILQAGHNTKSLAIAFMPAVIGGMYMAYRTKALLGIALSGVFMAFELACNHLQVSYYLGFLLLAFGIVELIRFAQKKELKKFVFISLGLIAAYGVAVAINYSNVALTQEYAKHTIRGGNDLTKDAKGLPLTKGTGKGLDKEYITQWSYGVDESFTLISPYVKGGGSTPFKYGPHADIPSELDIPGSEIRMVENSSVYWGTQPFTSGPVYVGIIMMVLFVLGLVLLKDRIKWGFLAVGILALMLSWGKNFMGLTDFFLEHVPFYNKFRTVTIILVLIELIVPIIGMMVLNELFKDPKILKTNKKPVFYVLGGFAALLLFMKVNSSDTFTTANDQRQLQQIEGQIVNQIRNADKNQIQQQYGVNLDDPQQLRAFVDAQMEGYAKNIDNVKEARKLVYQSSLNRSLIFLFLSGGLLLLLVYTETSPKYVVAGIGLLVAIDLIGVSSSYLNSDEQYWDEKNKIEYPHSATQADEQIMQMELQANPELQKVMDEAEQRGKEKAAELEASGATRKRIINVEKFRSLNTKTHYRVFDFSEGVTSATPSYFHKNLGGYHGAKLRSIQNVIEHHIQYSNMKVYDMMNVKYFMQGNSNQKIVQLNRNALGNAWFVKDLKIVENRDQEIRYLDRVYQINNLGKGTIVVNGVPVDKAEVSLRDELFYVENQDSTPIQLSREMNEDMLAYGVKDQNGKVDVVPDFVFDDDTAEDSFSKLYSFSLNHDFKPAQTAIASKGNVHEGLENKEFEVGFIELTDYSPMKMTYTSSNKGDGLAVFSEVFYPKGWKATIDGEEVDILNVNYLLRGLDIPKGEHEIVFSYDKSSYENYNMLSRIGSFLLLLLLGFFFWKEKKKDAVKND